MPAEAGFHGFLYWEIAMSKPSRERSTLASPSRTQAREPRNVSAQGPGAEERERAPALHLAGLRDPERLGVVADDGALEGVAGGRAGVERAAGVVAVVADVERARLVVRILDHDDVGAVRLQILALAEAPVEEGGVARLHVEHAAGLAAERLDAARAGGVVQEAVVGLRAVDRVDHLAFSVDGELQGFRLGGDGRGAQRGGEKGCFHGRCADGFPTPARDARGRPGLYHASSARATFAFARGCVFRGDLRECAPRPRNGVPPGAAFP